MVQSRRYRALNRRFDVLKRHFLPETFSSTGTYTQKELDNARAFRILIHAEIEHYFEDSAIEIATRAFDVWKSKSKPSAALIFMLTNGTGSQSVLPNKLGTKITALTISARVLAQYKHMIMKNNGIRTVNILEILLPIGIIESEIDSAWLSTIDGFGQNRGLAAHSTAISYQIDPKDDIQTVELIMEGIAEIDAKMSLISRKLK